VAAPEAANNAVNGPTLVPLLTLGIPGDNITAILLGAFVAQGLRPGPQLFAEQGPLVYGIIMAMIAANVLFLILGYIAVPVFARIITIRQSALLPVVFLLAFAGTYVYRSEPMDLVILLVFGVFGYVTRKFHFDYAPMVMAFILGPSLEYAFGQTMNLAEGRFFHYIFTERPIAAVFFSLIPVLGFVFIIRSLRKRRRSKTEEEPS
jgi:putative tricarboxylic transport membrane protein